jgi:hypothetical protein
MANRVRIVSGGSAATTHVTRTTKGYEMTETTSPDVTTAPDPVSFYTQALLAHTEANGHLDKICEFFAAHPDHDRTALLLIAGPRQTPDDILAGYPYQAPADPATPPAPPPWAGYDPAFEPNVIAFYIYYNDARTRMVGHYADYTKACAACKAAKAGDTQG